MLRIERLTYSIGGRVLLDQAEATVAPGHRVGLVGRNGSGKTTLFRLIAGELEADAGRIETPGRWRIGVTRQDAPDGDASLIQTVLQADTSNSLIFGGGKLIATVGMSDCIVVDTEDALLICRRGASQDVKKIIERLEEQRLTDYL